MQLSNKKINQESQNLIKKLQKLQKSRKIFQRSVQKFKGSKNLNIIVIYIYSRVANCPNFSLFSLFVLIWRCQILNLKLSLFVPTF